jgi:hypothetical protein
MSDTQYCPDCGTEINGEVPFCPSCGLEQPGTAGELTDDKSEANTVDQGDREAVDPGPQTMREHLNQFPGIDMENNTTRRNVLVGGGYTLVGLGVVGAIASTTEEGETDDSGGTDNNDGGDGTTDGTVGGDDDTTDGTTGDDDEMDGASDKELAEQTLREGYQSSDSDYREGLREVDTLDGYDGRDGYLIELRYDLWVDGFGSLEDDAEYRAGQVAVSVLEAMSNTDAENVTAVAIYAYVPTQSGDDSVSTKIVIDMKTINSIDWSSYVWQNLRDDADQYKFNAYLYD